MKAEQHLVVSATLSGTLYYLCPCWQLAVSAFLAGILIDLDHFIDYVIEFGISSDWRNFFPSFYEGQYTRIYVLLHAWEWLLVLGTLSLLTDWNYWVVGGLIGGTVHLVLDQLANGASGMGYSLLWRWSIGFDPGPAFPHKKSVLCEVRAEGLEQ